MHTYHTLALHVTLFTHWKNTYNLCHDSNLTLSALDMNISVQHEY